MQIDKRPDAALAKLLAEMQALMWVLPAKAMPVQGAKALVARGADRAAALDAEIEAGFDNMPV